MKYTLLAALVIGMLPAFASADRGRGFAKYDRGDRYHHGGGRADKGRFDVSFGFGSGGYRDYSYFNVGYQQGYGRYYAPRPYYRPYYAPPPVVYYPAPPVYYYDCGPRYYRPNYYCR